MSKTTPLRLTGERGGGVQQFKSAARLVLFLGMRQCVIQGGGGARGAVSVRLTRFVLSLFVLEESYERLPRCLALQREEMDEDVIRGRCSDT